MSTKFIAPTADQRCYNLEMLNHTSFFYKQLLYDACLI